MPKHIFTKTEQKNRMMGHQYDSENLYQSRIYRIWSNMKSRCTNPKDTNFKRYGGRGIVVCDRWQTFPRFYEDMKKGYGDSFSLDRVDNSGSYCKENCRWATRTEQARNSRNIDRAMRITFNGKTKIIREWAEELGIRKSTLHARVAYYGWSVEEALG